MGLADELGTPPAYSGTKPCSFKQWLDSLPPDDAAAVRTAVYRDRDDPLYWPTPKLHARLASSGWSGSDSVIYTHRSTSGCMSCR